MQKILNWINNHKFLMVGAILWIYGFVFLEIAFYIVGGLMLIWRLIRSSLVRRLWNA